MRIVHIQLRGPYTDNWGYQENILPRCQVRQGDDVYMIVQNRHHKNSGEIVSTDVGNYTLSDGVNVTRITSDSFFGSSYLGFVIGRYKYDELLEKIEPDCIFVHGMYTGIFSTAQLKKYKLKHKDVVIVADSHEYGFGLSDSLTLKQKVIRFIRRRIIKSILPYYEKVLCLSPKCVEFTKDYYKISDKNISVFPLGFDDSLCDISNKKNIRKDFRSKIGLSESDVVIIHGGKIIPRRRTDYAIQSVRKIRETYSNVKLVIFGGISTEIESEIKQDINDNAEFVIYLGHQQQKDYIDAFLASDIGLFPGAPSALWQEAIGCELYLLLCKGNDSEYLNHNNNVCFCDLDVSKIAQSLEKIIDSRCYDASINQGIKDARDYFSYTEMAKKLRQLVRD